MKKEVRKADKSFIWIFLLVILLIVLSGVAYFKMTGNIIYNSGDYSGIPFAPPFDVFDNNRNIFSVTPEYVSGTGDITFTLNVDNTLVLKKAYFWNASKSGWQLFHITDTTIGDSNWSLGPASKTITIPASNLKKGKNFFAIFTCKKYNGNWECGCHNSSETNCRRWSLQIVNVSNGSITPPVNP